MLVHSGPGALARLRLGIEEALAAEGWPRDRAFLVELAVDEAASNILEHGYAYEPGEPLAMVVRRAPGNGIEVSLWDRAPQGDLTRIPPGNLQTLAATAATRGRGRALVGMLTRSLSYLPRRGGGNVLTLTFDPAQLDATLENELRDAA